MREKQAAHELGITVLKEKHEQTLRIKNHAIEVQRITTHHRNATIAEKTDVIAKMAERAMGGGNIEKAALATADQKAKDHNVKRFLKTFSTKSTSSKHRHSHNGPSLSPATSKVTRIPNHAIRAPMYRTARNAESAEGYYLKDNYPLLHNSQLEPYKDIIEGLSVNRKDSRHKGKVNELLAQQVEALDLADGRAGGGDAGMSVD